MGKYKYSHVALGGTFDFLHRGHITLLEKAFLSSRLVSIGITTDEFNQQLQKIPYENQQTRRKNLISYLIAKNYQKRSKIIWLSDIYGNTLIDKNLQAVIVSKETLGGANEINKARLKKRLKKLTVIVCPPHLAKDKKLISSTRIRSGEIARDGKVYTILLGKIANKKLPETIRLQLKKPFGKIIRIRSRNEFGMTEGGKIIAVGDISVANLLKAAIIPHLSIVDFYVQRKVAYQNLTQLGFGSANPDVIVKNEAGQVSKNLIDEINKAMSQRHKSIILVEGEEDLATIPAILLAPIGSSVIYGQPNKGAVLVNVTPDIKDKLCKLLGIN